MRTQKLRRAGGDKRAGRAGDESMGWDRVYVQNKKRGQHAPRRVEEGPVLDEGAYDEEEVAHGEAVQQPVHVRCLCGVCRLKIENRHRHMHAHAQTRECTHVGRSRCGGSWRRGCRGSP